MSASITAKPHSFAPLRRGVGAAIFLAVIGVSGCVQPKNNDPRAGGLISGVRNLYTGGYDAYVDEKKGELNDAQGRADTLESRAREIRAERQALDRELDTAALEIAALQRQLDTLAKQRDTTRQRTAEQAHRLTHAQQRATQARARLSNLRDDRTRSVAAQRASIDDLKSLIGNVALMVNELSG